MIERKDSQPHALFRASVPDTSFEAYGDSPKEALREIDDLIISKFSLNNGGQKGLEHGRELGSQVQVVELIEPEKEVVDENDC